MSITTTIVSAQVEFGPQRLKIPLVLSSGPIDSVTEAVVSLRVRTNSKEAIGRGSIYLSDLWAWPDPRYTHEQRDALLQDFCRDIAEGLNLLADSEPLHPLELGLRLHNVICHGPNVPERFKEIPILARAMCLSPFDAAIHDGVGIALRKSAFEFYDEPAAIPSADDLFPHSSAIAAIGDVIRPPQREIPAWLIVGKNDDLQRDVRPWAVDRGYRCFKLKIMGKESGVDAARTAEVYQAAKSWGVSDPWLSVDSNEANPDAQSVMDYLQRLESLDGGAFHALKYLEQPTGRDIRQYRFDWHEITKRKPVLLDEGLTSLSLLHEAAKQGWNGLALKTCKGHSFALVAAAWAKTHDMLLSLQDLTNPGYSFIHAALFAAFVPTINGVELNSPQFTPDANAQWSRRLPDLFEPRDGMHRLPEEIPVGLGSGL
jgi:L-alanine-DL-glutamate epimerase-like enolase superfamily enzyme